MGAKRMPLVAAAAAALLSLAAPGPAAAHRASPTAAQVWPRATAPVVTDAADGTPADAQGGGQGPAPAATGTTVLVVTLS